MFLSPLDLLPAAEEARLFALTECDIFQSLREPVFDELVLLATTIFKVPISLIGLVGTTEVYYKAGYEQIPSNCCQQRQEAICALVVRRNQAVVFTDLAQLPQRDQLTAMAYASAQQKHLRFYAGVPLRTPDHHAIGTLCVIDRQPRIFDEVAVFVLEQLALLVERIIVVRHLCQASTWLGGDSWKAVQVYVVQELQTLATRVRRADAAAGGAPTTLLPAVLQQVMGPLNALGSVLAEPLPGFA